MSTEITPFGYNIPTNEQGMLSLNELYRMAESPQNKDPRSWARLEGTLQLVDALESILNVCQTHIIKSSRGKGGGTYAHKNLALSYAKYLDPKLAVIINQIYFERVEEEKNPQLAIERAKNAWRRQGKSDKWIAARMASLEERKSFTHTLKEHGVIGIGYKECTNAVYTPLWGGGAEMVRAKKSLPAGSNCRDHMNEVELAGVRLAELLAEQNIEENAAFGNKEVQFYCEKASKSVAFAIMSNSPIKKFDKK